jgi:hypothetical protein
MSVDAVVDDEHHGSVIDVNPRLVEPVNSELSGTDLMGTVLAASLGERAEGPTVRQSGVGTHMLLMARCARPLCGGVQIRPCADAPGTLRAKCRGTAPRARRSWRAITDSRRQRGAARMAEAWRKFARRPRLIPRADARCLAIAHRGEP